MNVANVRCNKKKLITIFRVIILGTNFIPSFIYPVWCCVSFHLFIPFLFQFFSCILLSLFRLVSYRIRFVLSLHFTFHINIIALFFFIWVLLPLLVISLYSSSLLYLTSRFLSLSVSLSFISVSHSYLRLVNWHR